MAGIKQGADLPYPLGKLDVFGFAKMHLAQRGVKVRHAIVHIDGHPHIRIQHMIPAVNLSDALLAVHAIHYTENLRIFADLIFDVADSLRKRRILNSHNDQIGRITGGFRGDDGKMMRHAVDGHTLGLQSGFSRTAR
ncbi:hypothetical protein SDC9_209647 [bioreactor metagenome]|uniref:Uncharacterized protein n=1 Tax=bioreactor metagenome TaxID=1076179 RepID=A0A645JE80_9ZZZZ